MVWIQAFYEQRTGYAAAMAFTAVTVFSTAVIATALGRERRGRRVRQVMGWPAKAPAPRY